MRRRIEPVYAADVEAVATLAGRYNPSGLSERDLLHAAVAMRVGPAEIVFVDRGFGKFPEVELLKPKDLDARRPRPEA
jgi:predicted nucleic acid-binding protein